MKRTNNRLALLAVITVCLVASAAQAQIQQSFFGMGASSSSDMPKVSYGTLSHPPLAWTMIEGTGRGVYDFSNMDLLVLNAPRDADNVAQIDLVMGWTPAWAVTSKTSCFTQESGVVGCTVPPTSMTDWTDFITALVQHYNGSTAPHIKYYEIWNEANTTPFWTGTVTQLIAMAQAAYPILKQDRYSSVMTPSVVWPTGVSFMTSYLSAGGYKYADGLTFHGYTSQTGRGVKLPVPLPESSLSTNAPIQTMVAAFRVVANANGLKNKPIATTEGGWGVNGVTDPDMQSAWIAQYEIVQAGMASLYDLEFTSWYTWGHSPSGTIETTTGEPTEAGDAYQEVYKWLLGQIPAPCTSSGNIWSCPVSRNLIVWDISQTCSNGVCTTSSYTPPKGYSKYVDLTGTTANISGSIALGVKPIMMEP
jgi:hypothetical protein